MRRTASLGISATPVTQAPDRTQPTAARLLGGCLLIAAAGLTLRTGWQVQRELAAYRRAGARLRTERVTIPSIAGDGDLCLHGRAAGSQNALPHMVLVHGFGVGSGYLVPLAGRLSEHTHVYAPDLPGHGKSEHDIRPLRVGELAAALVAWLDVHQLRAVLLVGHSLGCQIAAETAALRPDLVAGLVLVGPTSDAAARTLPRQLARGLLSSLFDRFSYVLLGLRDYSHAGVRVLAEDARQMIEHHIECVLPRVGAPVRVVRGGRDRLVPQAWAEAVSRVASAPAPTVIDGWGHAVHYDDPGAESDLVLAFARTIAGPARGGVPLDR